MAKTCREQSFDLKSIRSKRLLRLLFGYGTLALLVLITPRAIADSREKTDVIYMRNGDKITCEIRSLEKGELTVKPDYTDSTVVIDWEKVDHIQSTQQFVVSDPQGILNIGSLAGEPKTGAVTVESATNKTLSREDVIEIEPLGGTFLKRMRGDVDVGLDFARSNSQKIFRCKQTLPTNQRSIFLHSTRRLSLQPRKRQLTRMKRQSRARSFARCDCQTGT